MQSRLLRYFVATYNSLNITTAADALAITQPALTKSIQQLEAELGVALFERQPNGVMPTRFGDVLARHCATIFLEYDHALAEIEAMKGGSAGTIRVGAGPLWITHFLPAAIADFRVDHPNVRFVLEGAVISTAVPALLRGNIDVFCGALDFPDQDDLLKREVAHIEHVVLLGRQHPLLSMPEYLPAALLDYPWAMLAGDEVGRRQLAAHFARNGLAPPRSSLESTSVVSILESMQQGDFITCLARPLLQSQRWAGLTELRAAGVIWRYPAGLAIRSKQRLPAILGHFVECVTQSYARMSSAAASQTEHDPPA